MIKIRPHHILCMKAYIGKGYSKEFNKNMENVICKLKDDSKEVEIVFGLDDICEKCPYNMGNGICKTQDKVNCIDSKIIGYFDIEEGKYKYNDLKKKVLLNLDEEKFDNICENCEWYSVTNCKKLILEDNI
ncbi:MAG: DUF1284 domain-containing protein [Romboutsia sp.]